MSGDKLKRPVTAIRQLDYEFAVYLAMKPSDKRRLKERQLRRRIFVAAFVVSAVLAFIARWAVGQ